VPSYLGGQPSEHRSMGVFQHQISEAELLLEVPPGSTKADNLINETIAFWAQRGVRLTPEQARCAIKSVKDLYVLLDKWDRGKQ